MRWFNGSVGACALVAGGMILTSGFAEAARGDEPGELLKDVENSRQVSVEALRRAVQVEVGAARQSMADDPRHAIASLKGLNDVVLGSPDLSANNRAELHRQIAGVLREASRREADQFADEEERAGNVTAEQDRQRLISSLERRELKIVQLTDRFNALLDEQRFELAEEVAEVAATDLAERSAVGPALPLKARTTRYVRDALATRIERQKGVVDTLHRVEMAHIPQSDEPPIVYIDAAEWQELTHRRDEYSTDMYEEKPAEARIRQALDEITELEFNETELGDVLAYLKDRHEIEIQLDEKSLDEIGSGSNTPVTMQIRGITLRSALRLLLRRLDLTYTIRDEVLYITTPEAAAAIMVPHEYRVGDIVLPIANMNFSGGLGQLGGSSNNGMFGTNPGQGQGQNNQNQNQNGNPFGRDANNFF